MKNAEKTRFRPIEFGQFLFRAVCTAATAVKYGVFESALSFLVGICPPIKAECGDRSDGWINGFLID